MTDSERNKITLPPRLDTELARKIFDKAIEEGYIIINDNHYEWTLNKVLLAYMCGRIYCEDYPEKQYMMRRCTGCLAEWNYFRVLNWISYLT